jgi:UDPglucose 6-dehydrogenase
VESAYHAAQGADVLVILTEWNEFRALDLEKLARKMTTPRMADLRNIYNRDDVLTAGFETYVGVGR